MLMNERTFFAFILLFKLNQGTIFALLVRPSDLMAKHRRFQHRRQHSYIRFIWLTVKKFDFICIQVDPPGGV